MLTQNGRREGTRSEIEWAQTSAMLDQVRGVLFARSNAGGAFLVPVSTLAIRHALLARNVSADTGALLAILEEMRDVQRLPRGHWLPVHSRVIPCGDIALLVSGQPTAMLARDYGFKILNPGLGRLLMAVIGRARELPTESIVRWIDAPKSTAEWCEQVLRTAEFGEASGVSDMEIYDHWSARSGWRWLPSMSFALPDGLAFARHVHQQTKATNHYLLRIRDGVCRAMHELPHGFDSRRFAIALRGRAGNPVGFSVQPDSEDTWILRGRPVPQSELRLLRSLGFTAVENGELTTRLPAPAVVAVRDILFNLGLRERSPGRGW